MHKSIAPLLALLSAACATTTPKVEAIIYESPPAGGAVRGWAINIFGDLFTESSSGVTIEERLNEETGGAFRFEVDQGAMLSATHFVFRPSQDRTELADAWHRCALVSVTGGRQLIECEEKSTGRRFRSEIDPVKGLIWFENYCFQGLGGVCTFRLVGSKGLWSA